MTMIIIICHVIVFIRLLGISFLTIGHIMIKIIIIVFIRLLGTVPVFLNPTSRVSLKSTGSSLSLLLLLFSKSNQSGMDLCPVCCCLTSFLLFSQKHQLEGKGIKSEFTYLSFSICHDLLQLHSIGISWHCIWSFASHCSNPIMYFRSLARALAALLPGLSPSQVEIFHDGHSSERYSGNSRQFFSSVDVSPPRLLSG